MRFPLIDRVIQEEGLYMLTIYNIVEKHFSISLTNRVRAKNTRAKPGRVASIV
jgi:hypothetical protein